MSERSAMLLRDPSLKDLAGKQGWNWRGITNDLSGAECSTIGG
jgi:hypothetical protein